MSINGPALIVFILFLSITLGLACENAEQATDEGNKATAGTPSTTDERNKATAGTPSTTDERNKTSAGTPSTTDERNKASAGTPSATGEGDATPVLWPTIVTLKRVEELLEKGADINANDFNGNTLLHQAAMTAGPDVIELLLGEGAEIEAADERGNSPLHAAARYGEAATVVALIDAGANVDAYNVVGEVPLTFAVESGDVSIAEALLDGGANPNVSGVLTIASPEMRRLLVSRGADPNPPSADEYSPIHAAAERGDVVMVQYWLDNGADVNADSLGQTPLHFAIGTLFRPGEPAPPATPYSGSDVEEYQAALVVKLLLNHGADTEIATLPWGLTPLLKAAELGRAELVKILLDHGASTLARDTGGQSVLILALEADPRVMQLLIDRQVLATFDTQMSVDACHEARMRSDTASLLLAEHCDAVGIARKPSAVVSSQPTETETPATSFGPVSTISPHLRIHRMDFDLQWVTETPLHRAVVEGSVSQVQALLSQRTGINATATVRLTGKQTYREWTGMTPLHLTALNPNPEVARVLLDGGASVNARAQHGLTALHVAARLASIRHVRAMLDGGAKIEARDDDGRTPLHWALEGDPNVVAMLLDSGADIEAKNNDGFTPLHWAAAFADLEPAAFFPR